MPRKEALLERKNYGTDTIAWYITVVSGIYSCEIIFAVICIHYTLHYCSRTVEETKITASPSMSKTKTRDANLKPD
jgi:hypothetical protein